MPDDPGRSFAATRLRHAYAQRRYEELTGLASPAEGGPARKSLSPEQRHFDQDARLAISRELGHERAGIVKIYIGKASAMKAARM